MKSLAEIYPNIKRIHISEPRFYEMAGKEQFDFLVIDDRIFRKNEMVVFVLRSPGKLKKDSIYLVRYVIECRILSAMLQDDTVINLIVSPFDPARSRLGLSGVQNKDNLESI